MTGERPCGACGAVLTDTPLPFCPSCGAPVSLRRAPAPTALAPTATPAAPPLSAPPPARGDRPPAPEPPELMAFGTSDPPPPSNRTWFRPRLRRWQVVVVALVVVAVGVVATVSLLRDQPGTFVAGIDLPAAVTSPPREVWSYHYGGDYLSGAAVVGDRVVLSTQEAVVGLDEQGREIWTDRDRTDSFFSAVPGRDDVVAFVGGSGEDAFGAGVLSTDDGRERWFEPQTSMLEADADGLLLVRQRSEDSVESDVSWVDVDTGHVQWELEGLTTVRAGFGFVYGVRAGELTRYDLQTGEADWSVDLSPGSLGERGIAVTRSLVALASADEVAAYDADDGEQLWSRDLPPGDNDNGFVNIDAYSDDRVLIAGYSFDEGGEPTDTTVTVVDRSGGVETVDPGTDGFYGVGITAAGRSWFVDFTDADVYDEDVHRVMELDGELQITDVGVYAAHGDALALYQYGETASSWEIELPPTSNRSVVAADDVILVSGGGEVTAYR